MTADTTLAHIIDGLMYEMPVDKQTVWKERFRDFRDLRHIFLSQVATRLIISALRDCRPNARPDGQAAIDLVIALYQRQLAGDEPAQAEWQSAYNDAEKAAQAARWWGCSGIPNRALAYSAEAAAKAASQAALAANWHLASEAAVFASWTFEWAARAAAWTETAFRFRLDSREAAAARAAARSSACNRYAEELHALLLGEDQ